LPSISFNLLHVPAPIKKMLYVFKGEKGFTIDIPIRLCPPQSVAAKR
jgi:hypothetical protein